MYICMSNQNLTEYNILFREDSEVSVNYILKGLVELGLTQNEAKLYMYLAKSGAKKAIDVSKALNIPRTETYHLLTKLQNKGLVITSMQHPIKYIAISFEEAIDILIGVFEEKVKSFTNRKSELLNKWAELPQFAYDEVEERNKMQILEGKNSIYSKAKELCSNAMERLRIIADEKEMLHLYHYEVLDCIKSDIDVKVITDLSNKFMSILGDTSIQICSDYDYDSPCFIMKDYDEILLFMNDEDNIAALWTDCKSIIQPIDLLFKKLWH